MGFGGFGWLVSEGDEVRLEKKRLFLCSVYKNSYAHNIISNYNYKINNNHNYNIKLVIIL